MADGRLEPKGPTGSPAGYTAAGLWIDKPEAHRLEPESQAGTTASDDARTTGESSGKSRQSAEARQAERMRSEEEEEERQRQEERLKRDEAEKEAEERVLRFSYGDLVINELQSMALNSRSGRVRIKALELLGKTVGLFNL